MGSAPAARAASRVMRPMGPAPLRGVDKEGTGGSVIWCRVQGKWKSYSRNEHLITQNQTSSLDTSQSDSQGLTHGPLLVGDVVGELVNPLGRVGVPPGEGSVERRSGEEDNVGA